MRITFDPAKNARNIAERGLSFELAADLEWETALAIEDTRKDYGERRMRILALLGQRLHAAVVTYRGGALRVISFRKANKREVRYYGEEKERRGDAVG
ncbi:MAG TPA: BrnT family toxin [Roseiarcus sp.]|nr:BrnT family toxin [Roseiarcus sp.]